MSEGFNEIFGFVIIAALIYVIYKAESWQPNEAKVRKAFTEAIRKIVPEVVIDTIEETNEMGPFGPVDIDWRPPLIAIGSSSLTERISPTKYYLITLSNGDRFHGKISSTLQLVRHVVAKKL